MPKFKLILSSLTICLAFCAIGAIAAPEQVTLTTPTGDLFGTLELPAGEGPFTVALIHAGSGPTDRDCNNPLMGDNNALKMLAEGLAAQGIASLRFDKRGIAASREAMTSEEDLRFETYIDDAVAWGEFLGQDERLGDLFVVGHSEGSLIGMIAARRLAAAGFVSIAGVGTPAGQILRTQLEPKLPEFLYVVADSLLTELEAGNQVVDPSQMLASLFRPSVQPYMISWLRYDPAQELGRLAAPILVVQGTTDLQVGEQDARLLADAGEQVKLLIIPGMNHILKEVGGDEAAQILSYGDPDLPLAPGLVAAIAEFIQDPVPGKP